MNSCRLLVNIVNRDLEKSYMEFYKKNGIETVFSTPANGTASKNLLDYLGLAPNAKTVLQTVVTQENAVKLMQLLVNRMGINLPGSGIALTIPLGSIAGTASFKYLTDGQKETENGGIAMDSELYALIIAIVENGFSDMVMDAAREAGARGGTVVHAKGTGSHFTQKFFGVSLASEKEMVYIVTRKEGKNAIMKAIMEKAGPQTDAKAAVLSLPVEDVAGLCSVTDVPGNDGAADNA